jgi:hypothetical protein
MSSSGCPVLDTVFFAMVCRLAGCPVAACLPFPGYPVLDVLSWVWSSSGCSVFTPGLFDMF